MTVNEDRVKEKLREALCNLYNSEINFASEVSVKGLLGFTLDKKNILLVDVCETFSKDVLTNFHLDGQTNISFKGLAPKDHTAKRPAAGNLNESCKRQKIGVSGSEPPSILSALTNVDAYPNKKSIEDGIAHKHQINKGFTTMPSLADSSPREQLNDNQDTNESFEEEELEVKKEPVSDDEDVKMQEDRADEPHLDMDCMKTENSSSASSPVSPDPFAVGTENSSGGQLTGMNMFATMYNIKNPLYTPYQGVHHRYQMDGESSGVNKKQYHCDQCSYTSLWPSNLRRHKQKHLDPDYRPALVHQCEKCDYKAGWLSNLRRHLRTVHGENQEKVYECPSCMTIQIAKEEPVTCKKCSRTFTSSDTFKQHVQSIMQQQMSGSALGGGGDATVEDTVKKITNSVLSGGALERQVSASNRPGRWDVLPKTQSPSMGRWDRLPDNQSGQARTLDADGALEAMRHLSESQELGVQNAMLSSPTQEMKGTQPGNRVEPPTNSRSSPQQNSVPFQDSVADTSASFLMKRMRDVYGWTDRKERTESPNSEKGASNGWNDNTDVNGNDDNDEDESKENSFGHSATDRSRTVNEPMFGSLGCVANK